MKNIDETISIPEKYINNYDDFERLDLSNKEIEIYKTLNKISLDVNKEVIKVLYKDGESDYIISELSDKVYIPKYLNCMKDLCIYHSHTNVTPLSRRDMIKLYDKNIKKIGCITSNGDIFEIEIGSGYIPDDYDEFDLSIHSIYNDICKEIRSESNEKYSFSERCYYLIRETMYRVVRYYGWTIRGGNIYE